MSFLDKILAVKKEEIQRRQKALPREKLEELVQPTKKDFRKALSGKDQVSLIAEVKMASPSQGRLKNRLGPLDLAALYDREKVSAISVLTEEKFFHGSVDLLKEISERVSCPVLRKDFIIDEYQLLEARYFGADAVLLIASLLSLVKMKRFLKTARRYGMAAICEVNTMKEVAKVLRAGAEIIGINNRNLQTLSVDLRTTKRLVKVIPPRRVIVSESGIRTADDLTDLQGKIDAVLVGQALVEAKDIKQKIKSLTLKSC